MSVPERQIVKDARFNSVVSTGRTTLPIVNLSTANPPIISPMKGDIAYDVISDQVWFSNGTTWASVASTGAPSGPAGGDLSGTYPNPDIALGAVTPDKLAPGTDGTVMYYDGATNSWKTDTGLICCMGENTYNNSSPNSVTIGASASTASSDSVSVGANASVAASCSGSISIGTIASVQSPGSIAIGSSSACDVTGFSGVAIGSLANCSAGNGVTIGANSSVTGANTIAIGSGAQASNLSSIAIGFASNANIDNSIVLGASGNVTGASNAVGFGCNTASTPVGLFGITLNSASRQIECHSSFYANNTTTPLIALDATCPRVVNVAAANQINLPDCTSVTLGFSVKIFNNTGTNLPVHIAGGGLVTTITTGGMQEFTCIDTSTNITASWYFPPAFSNPAVYQIGSDILFAHISANFSSGAPNQIIPWDVVEIYGTGGSIAQVAPGTYIALAFGVYQITLTIIGLSPFVTAYVNITGLTPTTSPLLCLGSNSGTATATFTRTLTPGQFISALLATSGTGIFGDNGLVAQSALGIIRLA